MNKFILPIPEFHSRHYTIQVSSKNNALLHKISKIPFEAMVTMSWLENIYIMRLSVDRICSNRINESGLLNNEDIIDVKIFR